MYPILGSRNQATLSFFPEPGQNSTQPRVVEYRDPASSKDAYPLKRGKISLLMRNGELS